MIDSAAIICTRNRPEELRRTLASIAAQTTVPSAVHVVDASDSFSLRSNRKEARRFSFATHHHYTGRPSLARQRNYGLECLSAAVEVVFYLDDDVTLAAGYFQTIRDYLHDHPNVVGVGGYDPADRPPPWSSLSPLRRLGRRLFLLDTPRPGCVLPSGAASSPNRLRRDAPVEVEWLRGFSMTFRRTVLSQERLDASLEGYSHLEDRDLGLRMSEHGALIIHPDARLTHRRSSSHRLDPDWFNYTSTVHLYWFVEKNLGSTPNRLAFWWGMLGKFLILLASSHPDRNEALRGFLRGIQTVWHRDHPLLRSE
jgi:GT2 family glycosyltransferase